MIISHSKLNFLTKSGNAVSDTFRALVSPDKESEANILSFNSMKKSCHAVTDTFGALISPDKKSVASYLVIQSLSELWCLQST